VAVRTEQEASWPLLVGRTARCLAASTRLMPSCRRAALPATLLAALLGQLAHGIVAVLPVRQVLPYSEPLGRREAASIACPPRLSPVRLVVRLRGGGDRVDAEAGAEVEDDVNKKVTCKTPPWTSSAAFVAGRSSARNAQHFSPPARTLSLLRCLTCSLSPSPLLSCMILQYVGAQRRSRRSFKKGPCPMLTSIRSDADPCPASFHVSHDHVTVFCPCSLLVCVCGPP